MTLLVNFSSGPGPLGTGVSMKIRPSASYFAGCILGG